MMDAVDAVVLLLGFIGWAAWRSYAMLQSMQGQKRAEEDVEQPQKRGLPYGLHGAWWHYVFVRETFVAGESDLCFASQQSAFGMLILAGAAGNGLAQPLSLAHCVWVGMRGSRRVIGDAAGTEGERVQERIGNLVWKASLMWTASKKQTE